MGRRGEGTPHARGARAGQAELPKRKPNLKKLWPQVWALVAPRKWLIASGMVLMAINRVAGLVLPYTSKSLLDGVLSPLHPHPERLLRIIALVFSAMVVQAITSFSLTQLLSKAGQRLIAEMRRQVQRHVGLLSVAYYDENRTGTLVARIMTDVEGVRNLVGTGLVDFVGDPQRHSQRHLCRFSLRFLPRWGHLVNLLPAGDLSLLLISDFGRAPLVTYLRIHSPRRSYF